VLRIGLVFCAPFSPDGTRIVTASDDNTARIWDAVSAKEIAVVRGHGGRVTSAAFSPDGTRIVTASDDNTARIWDAASAKEIAVVRGHGGRVTSAAFSPDGTRIVTASADKTARIWDAASAKEIVVLHDDGVYSAAFSPGGSRIVTASGNPFGISRLTASGTGLSTLGVNDTARIWDAATGKLIAVLPGHQPVLSAAFSPDGSRIITASADRSARIWDAHLQTMPARELLAEACDRLAGVSKLTREEMRVAGYPDSMSEIDVCTSGQ